MSLIKLQVKTTNQKYPIIIGKGSVNKLTVLMKKNSIKFNQCLVVVDNNIPKKIPTRTIFFNKPVIVLKN